MLKSSSFFFVRHGHTDPFCNRLYCGGEWDVPLNESGIKQAKWLGAEFHDILSAPSHLYVSPMIRVVQTAELLMGSSIKELIIDERLREWKLGEWDTLSWEKLPSIFDRSIIPSSTETREDFEARINQFLQERLCFSHKSIVVSHGLVWNAIAHLLNLQEREISPCGLVYVEKKNDQEYSSTIIHKGFPL